MTRRLLAVLAHPDDESFGIGGTLARYGAAGAAVHVAVATDGSAGSVAAGYEDQRQRLVEVRAAELAAAVAVLGVQLHTLDYRDSGYLNDPANDHPDAFINADEEEAVARVVHLIRKTRPQVIITHDETGGYFHPDHIFCCKITTAAFHAAEDAHRFPAQGPAPYRPQRLYYSGFSNRMVRFRALMMRLRGQDPTRAGRNRDIDYTSLGLPEHRLHAVIDIRRFWHVKADASARHASQGGSARRGSPLSIWLQKHWLARETFIRAYPPVPDGFRETDLFRGVDVEV